MAKTTSQIIAENKIKRAEEAATSASRNLIHQQQMAGVAEKAAARTLAVLKKAISGTSDSSKKSELSRAAQVVTEEYKKAGSQKKTGPKTATDMQQKKEERAEERHQVDSLQIKKDRAEKALKDFDENKEIDWTDTNQRKQYDAERKRLQEEVDRAGAEIDARKGARTLEADLAEYDTWDAEDRTNLDRYIAERDQKFYDRLNPTFYDAPVTVQDLEVNPIVQKYGEKRVNEIAESLSRHRNAQNTEKMEQAARESAGKNGWAAAGHSLLSVPANVLGGGAGLIGLAKEASQRTGRYATLDPNNEGYLLNAYAGAVRGEVAGNIAGDEYSETGEQIKEGGTGRQILSYGYQGIMSIADSISRSLTFGVGGGAALAASGAFTQAVSDASKQGATPQQAVALGVATAGMEYVSEKIPMDEVFKLAKAGNTKVLAQAFKQAGVEITTEELSLFGSMAAEAAILREKSSYRQQIGDLVANGTSYEEAKAQADKGVWNEVLQTAAVSGFAGGFSGGGAAIVGNLATNNAPEVTEEVQQETPVQPPPEAPLTEPVRQTGPSTEPLLEGIQDMTPPPAPLPERLQHFDNAAAIANGVQSAQENAPSPIDESAIINTDPTQHTPQERRQTVNSALESDYNDEFESWGADPNREGVENPMADRSYSEVGKRSVKAYMYENPAVKPFYQEQAVWLLSELADSTKGERTYNEQVHYESGGEQGWTGTKRHTSESIAELLDQDGMTYDQIEKGLSAIVNDHGQENNAVSKRIEFIINDRLMNGYTDFYTGQKVPGNAEYLDLLRNQQSAPSADTQNQSAEGGLWSATEQNPGIKGTGAAEGNFSGKPAYNATLSEDNAQADRWDDVRPMELPQQDINGGNVSAVTGNVYGSRITPDDFASLMEEPAAKGDFSYAKITNDQATQRATETIASAGTWENAYDSWKQSVTVGNAGAEMSARGALFLNHAAQQGNKQLWLETLHYMQKLGTNTAQGLQAFRIIRTLKPVDKIEFVKMSVEKMATEVREKHGIDLEIDRTLIDEFEQAETDADRDAVLEDIQQNVADQIPSTFLDKWTALRYMNMLGNLKTNVRNVAGNIGSATVYRIKDTIATGMETIASKLSGGSTERTKSLFVRKSLLNACKEDFQQFKETVSSGGKYGERMSATSQFEQGVQDKRRIFKNSALEAYRRGTNWMMNNEHFGDEAFGRAAYSRALAGYLQANGVTGSDLSEVDGALLDKARAYAIKEAQEATFHDNSALAKIVSKVQKDTGILGQGIMPFTKTPANVLTRAEEFSPLGLINSTIRSVQKARGNENITGADVINSWAKTMTGVGLFALGAAMMDQGLLTGGPDEDEEKAEFDELNGQQNYAIQLPDGTNYTIDWLTPAAMPMFMGAQFWKMLSSDRDLTFADMEQVFTSIADPMIQMSMLQGLNDSLDGIKYSDNNLGQFFINAAVSYLTQGLTNTLMGQFERSTEENRQTTYIDKDSNTPEWLQRQLGKASQKIPGWDYQQMDYRNAWGRTEKNEGGLLYNLLSPGYVSKETSDRVTQELYRLRETTGENVFPQAVEKTITYTDVTGTKHVNRALTQAELDTIQRVEGQTAMRLLAEITANEDYNSLTDTQRAAVIANVYKYAQEQGKKETLSGYYSEAAAWLQNMGDDAANGLIQRAALSTINSSVTKIVDNIENEWAVSPAAQQELDGLFDAYSGMSKEAQKQILDEAVSDTAKYLEIRSKGLDTTQYLDVVGDIKALEVEPNFSDIRDIQIREAIAENGSLSTREKDIVMRAYMPDYDPTAKSPQKTELKYDAIRKLDVSPEGYTAAYRDYLDASGTGKRRRTIAHYMKTYGWDRSTAQKVYDLYAGYWKPWKE